jgi:hypothetical protein
MKKLINIVVALTMLLSLIAPFRVQTASAAAGLDRAVSTYKYVDPYAGPTGSVVQNDTTLRSVVSAAKVPVFTMGEYIDGSAYSTTGTVQLRDVSGTVVGSSNIAGGRFRLSTDNVTKDGLYQVYDLTAGLSIGWVLIKYNVSIDQSSIDYCKTNYISGYVKHGDGTGASGVVVGVLYPNGDLFIYGTTGSHGEFSMTISANERGVYSIVVIDDYPTATHDAAQNSTASSSNTVDSIVYKQLTTTTLTWTLSTFVNPTIIYENAAGEQSFVLKLFADDGSPVEPNVSTLNDMTWTLTGFTLTQPVKEIAPGFYRFIGKTDVGASYVIVKVSATVGGQTSSAQINLPVTKLSYFNPQVVVNAYYVPSYYVATTGNNTNFQSGTGSSYCYVGRQVYDNLPCTIGTSLVIYPIVYKNVVPNSILDPNGDSLSATVSGPVTKIGSAAYFEDVTINNPNIVYNKGTRYLVNASGAIKVHFDAPIVWSRANNACSFDWDPEESVYDAQYNACCVPTQPVDFTICEQQSCTVDKVDTTKNSDGTYNIALTIAADPANKVNCELCEGVAVHIYTVSNLTDCQPNGNFEVWYNNIPASKNNTSTGIATLPITLQGTSSGLSYSRDGNVLTLKNLDFSSASCTDKFVVEVFGTAQAVGCTSAQWTHPLVYEKTLSIDLYSTTTLNATYTIKDRPNETKLVAGVCDKVEVTGAKFTLSTPQWTYVYGSSKGSLNPIDLGNGNYEFDLTSLLSDAGTITITGTATYGCKKEVATITIPVLVPQFTVKIGLLDGSVIDNDHIVTEGFAEKLYVSAKDPRDGKDLSVTELAAYSTLDGCEIPTSAGCSGHPELCTGINPLTVTGYDNPNTNADPQFDLMATLCGGVELYVDTFTLVKPTVKVALEDVKGNKLDKAPVSVPAVVTHVVFTVKDAHGHGAPGVSVTTSLGSVSGSSSGITATTPVASILTDMNGEADWLYVFTTSGMYYITAESNSNCSLPNECWPGINTSATFEAAYVKPVADTTAPTLTVTAPADKSTVNTATVKVTGKATDNVGVTLVVVNDVPVTLLPDGTFATTVTLAEGANTIVVKAFDAAGNVATQTLTVTYQKPAPTGTKIVLKIGSDIMTVNGKVVQLDAAPEIKEGRTFLPLRAIAEAFGAQITWVPETQGITVVLGDNQIGLQIGNNTAVVNGNVLSIVPPYIKNGRTMVPIRVIAEGFGAQVEWDPVNYIVTITMP